MASPARTSTGLLLCGCAWAACAQTTDTGKEKAELPRVVVSAPAFDPQKEPADVTEFDDAPPLRTPASVTVLTTRELRESGARSLSNAIRTVPAASDAYNTVGFIETLQVRGFVLDNVLNYRRNGLPVSNYAPLALENKERLELLKGLDGALAGTSSPGGLVNYVTKRPATVPIREVAAEVSERGTWNLAADVSQRAGPLGYRFNLATEERRPNARDAPGDRRFAAAAMDLRLPRDGLLEVEAEWQRSRQISVPGYGLLDTNGDGIAETLPPPIDPRINLNNQPWSLPFESRQVVGTLRYEQPLSTAWRVGVRGLAQRIVTNDHIAFPDGCSSGPNFVYPGLCGNYDIDIYDYRSNDERRTMRATEAYTVGRFATAGIGHRLQLGARATRYAERFPPLQAYNFVGTTNVFAPVVLPPDPTLNNPNTQRDLSLDEIYAYDALKFGPAWSAWLGVRRVAVTNRSALSGSGDEAVELRRDLVLPWAAGGWQPWTGGFAYVSWATGIEAEAVPNRPPDFANQVPGFDNAGEALLVGRSRQVEVGFKQAFTSGNASIAFFQVSKPYSADVEVDPGPPQVLHRVANGREVRHRGMEVSLTRNWGEDFAVDLHAAYIDAKNRTSVDPTLVGKRVTNVPRVAASLGTNWRPFAATDLQWRNRVGYTGSKAVNTDNSVLLPTSWQWDTAFIWTPDVASPSLQWRFGIDNVTDRRYWREAPTQPWGATYLFPAQPRTYRLGVVARW